MSLKNHYVAMARHSHRRAMDYKAAGNMNSAFRYMVQRDYFLEIARGS